MHNLYELRGEAALLLTSLKTQVSLLTSRDGAAASQGGCEATT